MRWYVGLFLALVLLFGCVNPPAVSNNTTNGTQNVSHPNVTGNATFRDPNIADFGDHVWVNYTLRVDGKVFDTNNITLANESGIYNPNRDYTPLDFTLDLNHSGVIPGFVLNIVGMKLNETLRFTVDPKNGYGAVDPNKFVTIPRYYNKSLLETVPKSYFTDRNISIENGSSFDTKYGTVFVQNISGDNVTIFYYLAKGQKIDVNGIPTVVAEVNMSGFSAVMEYNLAVNKTYQLPDPDTGATITYLVTNKTDTNITLDYNHVLAGKTLDFEVTLLKIQKGS